MDWLKRTYTVGWFHADGDAAASAGGDAASAAASASPIGLISAGVGALTGIASTIANISDQKKRTQFMMSINLLDNQQKQQLNEQLLAAKTQTDRLNILSNAVVQFATANQQAANRTKVILFVTSGALAFAMLALVVIKGRKK